MWSQFSASEQSFPFLGYLLSRLLKQVWHALMSENGKTALGVCHCVGCRSASPGQLAFALRPKCLLKVGLSTQFDGKLEETPVVPKPSKSSKGLPQSGELFGHYQMVRLLGQGGM